MGTSTLAMADRKVMTTEAFKAVFDAIDKDGNGELEKSEMEPVIKGICKVMAGEEALASAPPEQLDQMVEMMWGQCIQQIDADGDGKVSFDEIMAKADEEGGPFKQLDSVPEEEFTHGIECMGKVAECIKAGDYSGV